MRPLWDLVWRMFAGAVSGAGGVLIGLAIFVPGTRSFAEWLVGGLFLLAGICLASLGSD